MWSLLYRGHHWRRKSNTPSGAIWVQLRLYIISQIYINSSNFSFLADLGVVGKPCPMRLSAKDKERLDEQRVLAALQDEGLIVQRPVSRAAGGLVFEITVDKTPGNGDYLFPPIERKPPARLAKLERKKKRKKKMTLADIEAKLEQAEERRKVRDNSWRAGSEGYKCLTRMWPITGDHAIDIYGDSPIIDNFCTDYI